MFEYVIMTAVFTRLFYYDDFWKCIAFASKNFTICLLDPRKIMSSIKLVQALGPNYNEERFLKPPNDL